jgi:hypothetical protein
LRVKSASRSIGVFGFGVFGSSLICVDHLDDHLAVEPLRHRLQFEGTSVEAREEFAESCISSVSGPSDEAAPYRTSKVFLHGAHEHVVELKFPLVVPLGLELRLGHAVGATPWVRNISLATSSMAAMRSL